MGQRGPTPKPAARRQRRNKTPSTKLSAVPNRPGGRPETSPATPPAKREWLKATKDRWVAYWPSKMATVVDRVADMAALERLFDLYDERERASRAFRRQRVVRGSMGQPVLNPISRLIKECDTEIRMLEDRFGLTPAARLRMHIEEEDDPGAELDRLNRQLMGDDDTDDPRLTVIEGGAATTH